MPATAAPVGTTPDPARASVTGQVFPEVTRLVSRGDGTRRITLKLAPEALGEVRVVLTVRQGEVHVRMSGGDQAQQSLLLGAHELHRLLDQVGATSSQIVVGDRTSHDHNGRNPQDGGFTADGGSSHHGSHDHRTAGTRDGDTSARDGNHRDAHPRFSTDPAAGTHTGGGTRTRLSGVDVTM